MDPILSSGKSLNKGLFLGEHTTCKPFKIAQPIAHSWPNMPCQPCLAFMYWPMGRAAALWPIPLCLFLKCERSEHVLCLAWAAWPMHSKAVQGMCLTTKPHIFFTRNLLNLNLNQPKSSVFRPKKPRNGAIWPKYRVFWTNITYFWVELDIKVDLSF